MTEHIQQGPLQALVRFYDRMQNAPALGWSQVKFGWAIVLNESGHPVDVMDLRDQSGKKPANRFFMVPAEVKRTAGISPNFLWDKSSYVLGKTAKADKRTAQEHAAFVKENLGRIAGVEDAGLLALKVFLENWLPERFESELFQTDMLDANIMFRLDGDARYIHERPAARKLVEARALETDGHEDRIFCLVTGEYSKPARLHPAIKGVEGAQTSGASLVSFNCDAFTSYGKAQGENAPTSEGAAFRYGAALNSMLQRGSLNRVARPIGDTTVVFWAEASDRQAAEAADVFGAIALSSDNKDDAEVEKVSETLKRISRGTALHTIRPDLGEGTRFYVLGLAPNAARLSVRFWSCDTLDVFARNLAMHYQDIAVEPAPWRKLPSPFLLAVKTTAMLEKADNIPKRLAADMLNAILTGRAYPRTWLSSVIMRLRAGDDPTGWHAAAARAVLQRMKRKANPTISEKESVPMSLNRDYPNIGYQLGRLFAVYELAQRAALGGVNTTVRDKYFGAASATPASVFPVIIRNGQNHLGAVRKKLTGWPVIIEKELEEIFNKISPEEPSSFPRSLHLEQQGEFVLGYYHQRSAKLAGQKSNQLLPEIENDQEDEDA